MTLSCSENPGPRAPGALFPASVCAPVRLWAVLFFPSFSPRWHDAHYSVNHDSLPPLITFGRSPVNLNRRPRPSQRCLPIGGALIRTRRRPSTTEAMAFALVALQRASPWRSRSRTLELEAADPLAVVPSRSPSIGNPPTGGLPRLWVVDASRHISPCVRCTQFFPAV